MSLVLRFTTSLFITLTLLFWQASPQALALPKPTTPQAPIGDKWAVVIGISDFIDPAVPQLKFASKDARDFYDYLVDPMGGKFKPDHVKLLLNSDATKINIMDALGDSFLPHGAAANDLVVIYLSTHGSPAGADMNGVNYVIANDTQVRKLFATGIEMKGFLRTLKERLHTDRIVLILDTCYSGAGASVSGGHKGLFRTNINPQSVAQTINSVVISSSAPDQKAWESDELRNSYFTRYLIDALKEGGGKELGKAFDGMRGKVQNAVLKDKGELQTPVMAGVFSGPTLSIAVPPTVNREAPLTVTAMATTIASGKSTGSLKPGAVDLAAYGQHVQLGNKLVEENKTWDAIHEFEQATKANPETIEGYIVLSHLYDTQGRFKEMLTAARRAVVNDKDSSKAREALALANLRDNNIEEAVRQIQMAISLDPFNSMAHNVLGNINESKFNRVDQAEQEYRKALELNGVNTRALVNLGLLLEKHQKNYDEAESLLKKAIESDSDDWEAHMALGHLLYAARNKPQEAEKEIRKAIELAPANARLHSELGNVLSADKGRLEESEVELKKGVELANDKGIPHYLMANFLLAKRGRVDEAEREYRKALQMDSRYYEAMIALADLLVERKKVYDQSNDLYLQAIKINPKNPEAHLGLATIQERLFKNYNQAENELRTAISINPKYSLAHERLGYLLEHALKKYGDAKQSYQLAIEADKDNAEAHYDLALLLWSHYKNATEAKTMLEKANQINPTNSAYVTALARITSEELKQYKEAEKLFRKATELNFADSDAHYRLGMLLIEKLGRRKDGEAELKTALEQKPEDKEIKAACERFIR